MGRQAGRRGHERQSKIRVCRQHGLGTPADPAGLCMHMALWLNALYTTAVMETHFLPALQVLPSQDQSKHLESECSR